jgi:hypothetical protein
MALGVRVALAVRPNYLEQLVEPETLFVEKLWIDGHSGDGRPTMVPDKRIATFSNARE